MQEELKKVASITTEPVERTVTLYIRSQRIHLGGIWKWEMDAAAIYCSDVMSFPEDFVGTKAIIHPDDLPKLMGAVSLMEEKEIPLLDFRIITTYGQVKAITGQRVCIEGDKNKLVELLPGREPWEEALEQLAAKKENDFLQLRKELADHTERLYGIGSWLLNRQTGQAWYSDNVFRIHGLAPQSLNAHANTFNHFIHKEDRNAVLDAFEKAYTDHAPLHLEYRIVLATGEIHRVQQVTKWLYSVNGQVILGGIVRDVTDERVVADELLVIQSQTLLHQQLLKFSEQQSAIAYWYMNLSTRKTSYSDNYYRIYGFKQQVLPNYNSFLNLVHVDDRAKIRDIIEEMDREHVLPETEYRIIRPDGKMRYLKQNGKLFISPNRELIMFGVVQDISVQKVLEKKILELNESISLNSMVAETAEAVAGISFFIWLADGSMQWSDGFYRMLGYKPAAVEPLSRFLYKNIHPEDLKTFREAEALLMHHRSHDDIKVRLISKAGVRLVRISFRQISYGKDAIVALVHNISKQNEFEEQFRSNRFYTELLEESVSDMIIFTNSDHTVLHWNKVAEEKTGISKEDALYNNLFDVVPRLNVEEFLGRIHRAIRGAESHASRVNNFYLRQAHDYWLCPLKNEAGEVMGVLHVVHDVSKQLELQQQLSERLNFIESLVEASVDRIVVLDRFMNYLYWNKKAEEYYAINKERVLGKNILEIFPSFRNDPSYNEFRKVLKGETVYVPAVEIEESDEYFETYLIPVKDEDKAVTAVLWIVHDLSRELKYQKEKQKADEQIKEQAHYIARITETVPDMISVMELSTRKLFYLNKLTFREHGFDTDDMLTKSKEELIELIHPEDRNLLSDYYAKLSKAGDSDIINAEYRAKNDSGKWHWYHIRGRVFQRDDMGEVTHILNVIENIDERKRSEHEVLDLKDEIAQRATDKYYSLFNSIDDGFCIIEMLYDEEGKAINYRFLEVNQTFSRQTGLENIIGKTGLETTSGTEPYWIEDYDRVAQTGVSIHLENYHEATGRWYEAYASRVGNANSKQVAIVFNDITERKKAEEQLKNFTVSLEHQVAERTKELQLINGDLENFKRITDSAHDIIISLDTDGRITYWNHAAEILYGYSKEEVIGRQLQELIIPENRLNELASTKEMVVTAGQTVSNLETQRITKEGKLIDVLISIFPLKDDQKVFGSCSIAKEITDVKKAQEEIRKQLALLRYTEYLAQSGTWEYDVASEEFKWSEGMYKLLGLPLQMKVHPEIYLDVVVNEDRAIAKKIVNLLKKKYNPFEEIIRVKRNGDVRIIKIKSSVIADEKGKAKKIIGVDIDITHIRKAEEKLKESQHWLEQTAKASPDSITVYDLQKKQPVYLNNCLSEWLGIDPDELVAMGIEGRLNLIHPDDRLNLLHNNEKTAAAKDGGIVMMEYRIISKEGKTLWLRNRSKPFQRDASGKVTHILSILQNVTEEVELREELNHRTEYAEAIIDASIDRIAVYDKELRIIAWNKRSEQLTGRKKQQVLGQKLFDVFPKVGADEQLLKAHLDALEGSYVSLPARQGIYTNVYYERFFIPLKNERKETYAVVSVMHDVSELVKRNMELDELNQSLEEKNTELEQKNEEITSFAFVASHDMKEPLRKIHTFSDWLMEQELAGLSDKGRGLVEKINASVHRMEILIDDILVLTKIHSDTRKAEDVNLNKVLKQVFDEMFEIILLTQTGIQADELPLIKGNSNQIFYLFKNLISNAIKFQKPGNVPQIKITAEIIPGEEVNLSNPVDEYAKLSFADNGFGFDQRYAKKIFQVFQRLHGKHEFEGTGIGLAICKKIMENHEGMISVESEQGKGSVFSCYFPLH